MAPLYSAERGIQWWLEGQTTKEDGLSHSVFALGEAAQADNFQEGYIKVHYAQAADGAPKIGVVPNTIPGGCHGRKQVLVPIIRPGKDQQEGAQFDTEQD